MGNRYDFFEDLIYNECISIKNIDFHKDIDLMLVVLNSKGVLQQKISRYCFLAKATIEQLNNYELMAGGTGVHWSDWDEDLSPKGFLQVEIRKVVKSNVIAA